MVPRVWRVNSGVVADEPSQDDAGVVGRGTDGPASAEGLRLRSTMVAGTGRFLAVAACARQPTEPERDLEPRCLAPWSARRRVRDADRAVGAGGSSHGVAHREQASAWRAIGAPHAPHRRA